VVNCGIDFPIENIDRHLLLSACRGDPLAIGVNLSSTPLPQPLSHAGERGARSKRYSRGTLEASLCDGSPSPLKGEGVRG